MSSQTVQLWTVVITLIIAPNIAAIVAHLLNRSNLKAVKDEIKATKVEVVSAKSKIDHNIELSNSMLSKTTENRNNLEKKIEIDKESQLAAAHAEIAELRRQNALLMHPGPAKED